MSGKDTDADWAEHSLQKNESRRKKYGLKNEGNIYQMKGENDAVNKRIYITLPEVTT